ncbi:UNVERIFIED_CONTAM: hypothetical protein RMT77_004727 [Armadillidium vulgare]
MHMSLLQYLLILLLKFDNINCAKIAPEQSEVPQKEKCAELLNQENQKGEKVVGTIFEHVPPHMCFHCTKRKSEGDKAGVAEIPIYNNLFEFGFNAIQFPSKYTVEIRMTKECLLSISGVLDLREMEPKLSIEIKICAKSSNPKCINTTQSTNLKIDFVNSFCHSMAFAFMGKKIYFQTSVRCRTPASIMFDLQKTINIENEKCLIDTIEDNLHASIETYLRGYVYDGFPIMLPCSPGGYAVDPFTGRFLIDNECYNYFQKVSRNREEDGINFIIKKVYKNNENLIFPTKIMNPYNVKPIYMKNDGSPMEREKMKSKEKRNELKGNRTRIDCNYEKEEAKSSMFLPCGNLLTPENMKENSSRDAINYYVHRNGCFLCSKPKCNFSEKGCDKSSEIKGFPLYNNMIEFGVPALHFPMNTIVKIKITEECYYKLEIQRASRTVSIFVSECLSNNCRNITKDREKFDYSINFNNYYCVYCVFAFRDKYMISFGSSNLCNKFASNELETGEFNLSGNEKCSFDGKNNTLLADFEFSQDNSSTHSGVPLIVPCSTGGVFVNPKTGRFAIGSSCRKLVWEAIKFDSGIDSFIHSFYNSNENYLFRTESEANVEYPNPIYLKDNQMFIPFKDGVPKIVQNKKIQNKSRKGCQYIKIRGKRPYGMQIQQNLRIRGREEQAAQAEQNGSKNPKQPNGSFTNLRDEESQADYVHCDITILFMLGLLHMVFFS